MVLVKGGPREAIYCVQQQLYWSSTPLTQLLLGCREVSLFRRQSDVSGSEMRLLQALILSQLTRLSAEQRRISEVTKGKLWLRMPFLQGFLR